MSVHPRVAQIQWFRFSPAAIFISALAYWIFTPTLHADGSVVPSQYPNSQNQKLVLSVTIGYDQHWLSLADIETLPIYDIEMTHPEGISGRFTGVWLNDLIEQQGISADQRIRLIALDNYTVFLEGEERARTRYFLTTRLDGEPIALDQLGPLTLIAPDNLAAVRAGTMPLTRWIWSIKELRKQ